MSPVSARVLAALVAAGATPEQLVAAVEAEESADAERKERRREKWRLDKRRLRSKPCPPMSTETAVDIGGPPSFPLTLPLSPPVVVVGVNAHAREAQLLADDVLLIVGAAGSPPGWQHDAMSLWLATGLASGWQAQIVRIAARRVAAQRRGKGLPNSFRYLDKPILSEHELASRPTPRLPAGEAPLPEQRELRLVRPTPRLGPLPINWSPPQDARAYAQRHGLAEREIEREIERFRNHARQTDRHLADWDSAFKNWCLGSAERLGRAPAPTTTPSSFPQVRVESGTPQWIAWQAHLKRTTGKGSPCVNFGWHFPSEWPPDAADAEGKCGHG